MKLIRNYCLVVMKILTIILNKCVISPAKSSKRECQFEDLAKFVL